MHLRHGAPRAHSAGNGVPRILQLLSSLTEAIEGAPALALAAAAAWGVLSILLSPCHMAKIPLIVGSIGHWSSDSRGAAVLKRTCGVLAILREIYYLLTSFL